MTPTSEAELADCLKRASGPVHIRGGGTRGVTMPGTTPDITLDTRSLTGITLYEPGALTMVARAGTTLSEIEAALAQENQRIAFEVPDLRETLGTTGESTIGGIAATNASGPRRISVGACRDFMLGLRFVDGAGQIIKNGGRVMKNVTGYDLVKLMSGSHGTLGVLTELSFKVMPNVPFSASLRIAGLDPSRAVAAMSSALGAPYDVTGAARDEEGAVWLRLEGFEPSVRYRAEALQSKLKDFGAVDLVDTADQVWRDIRDARAFAGAAGDLWRVSVKPSDAPAVLDAVQPIRAQLDWGGGLIWLETEPGIDIRTAIHVPGHATLMRSQNPGLTRFHPEPAGIAALTQSLRARFDPRGILNTGLMEHAA